MLDTDTNTNTNMNMEINTDTLSFIPMISRQTGAANAYMNDSHGTYK